MARNHYCRLVVLGIAAPAMVLVGWPAPAKAQRITEFAVPLPPGNSSPGEIALGPDGALWFTVDTCPDPPQLCQRIGQIGRITTAGATTEYPIPISGSFPGEIAARSDGALWFTDLGTNSIGRITTTGTITEFSIPNPQSDPSGKAVGPDGAMWFTESSACRKIGRITTSGTITEYPIPTAASSPFAIAAGPDGAMWFTESSKVGRIAVPLSTQRNTSDFNDNGYSDILWRNGEGRHLGDERNQLHRRRQSRQSGAELASDW